MTDRIKKLAWDLAILQGMVALVNVLRERPYLLDDVLAAKIVLQEGLQRPVCLAC
jgi:hypothetical protein